MSEANNRSGFVLTEAIVAVALAAIAGAGLVAALASAEARVSKAEQRLAALRMGERLLGEGLAATVGSSVYASGQDASRRLTWTRTIRDLDPGGASDLDSARAGDVGMPGDSMQDLDRDAGGVQVVAVELTWNNLQGPQSLRLEGYRIGHDE